MGKIPKSASYHGYRSSEAWLPREPVISTPTGPEMLAGVSLPPDFDWRNVGGRSFVAPDLNQHIPIYCGACWLHGTSHALNDRIKVLRNGQFPDVLIGRQALMNCVPSPDGKGPPPGCNGGDAYMVHKYLHENKVPDDTCMPYIAQNMGCEPVTVCRNCAGVMNETLGHMVPDYCFAVEKWTGYGVGDFGNVSGEEAMMKEIYARGPIACNAATDHPFMYNYTINEGILKEGVYTTDQKYTKDDIDHVMEVAGWGETASGTKYWVVRNSWGTYWGDMGWVKIRRGVNQHLIESSCDWAVPDFAELDEQLKSRVLGNYILGTTNSGPRVGMKPGTSLLAAMPEGTASSAGGIASTMLIAVVGASAGSLVTGILMTLAGQRRKTMVQPVLLG
jgi:cathepsin X